MLRPYPPPHQWRDRALGRWPVLSEVMRMGPPQWDSLLIRRGRQKEFCPSDLRGHGEGAAICSHQDLNLLLLSSWAASQGNWETNVCFFMLLSLRYFVRESKLTKTGPQTSGLVWEYVLKLYLMPSHTIISKEQIMFLFEDVCKLIWNPIKIILMCTMASLMSQKNYVHQTSQNWLQVLNKLLKI